MGSTNHFFATNLDLNPWIATFDLLLSVVAVVPSPSSALDSVAPLKQVVWASVWPLIEVMRYDY